MIRPKLQGLAMGQPYAHIIEHVERGVVYPVDVVL
jgi:hypothetical protein